MTSAAPAGPLSGVRIVEVDGIGASPFGLMLLSDMGADVIRLERPGAGAGAAIGVTPGPVMTRGRRAIVPVDLKSPAGRALLMDLIARADVLTEAFRPGVAERLGFGPDDCAALNPRLVYGRMTGWGREGPLAMTAGHDIDYIAVAGVLGAVGRADSPPPPPLALAGDMGGGGLSLAFGIVCALLERERSGRGQVVDAAMVDGAASLMAAFWEQLATGLWEPHRERNLVDGGAPFYDTYECADGGYVAVGALEPAFWEALRTGLGIAEPPDRMDRSCWPALREQMRATFLTRTRDEWCERFAGTDACLAPVLGFDDAPHHPHNVHRGTFVEVDGIVQPGVTPRLGRTQGSVRPAPDRGADPSSALRSWGVPEQLIADLAGAGAAT